MLTEPDEILASKYRKINLTFEVQPFTHKERLTYVVYRLTGKYLGSVIWFYVGIWSTVFKNLESTSNLLK